MLDALFDPAGAPAPRSPLGEAGRARRLLPRGVAAPGATLAEAPVAGLWQVEAFAGRAPAVAEALSREGAPAPGPGRWTGDDAGLSLRVGPRVWWVAAEPPVPAPRLARGDASVLDLSHARCRVRLSGPAFRETAARLVALDAREGATPAGTAATAPLHGTAVVLAWHEGALDLWLPRSQARALFGAVVEVAAQFGVEVV